MIESSRYIDVFRYNRNTFCNLNIVKACNRVVYFENNINQLLKLNSIWIAVQSE